MTNHPPSVLWHCWLGHQTCKNRRPYNLYCVGADVKPCSINHRCKEWFLALQNSGTCRKLFRWCDTLRISATSLNRQKLRLFGLSFGENRTISPFLMKPWRTNRRTDRRTVRGTVRGMTDLSITDSRQKLTISIATTNIHQHAKCHHIWTSN